MKRSSVLKLSAAAVLILLVAVIVSGRGPRNKVLLGPMLPKSVLPDPDARQIASDMRAWLQDMGPSDAETLNKTGRIVFSWEKLRASDPKRARIVDDYIERKRRDIAKAFEAQLKGKPLPARLATHHNPDTVEFERMASGKYRVVIRSREGIHASYLEISGYSGR